MVQVYNNKVSIDLLDVKIGVFDYICLLVIWNPDTGNTSGGIPTQAHQHSTRSIKSVAMKTQVISAQNV